MLIFKGGGQLMLLLSGAIEITAMRITQFYERVR